MATAGDDGTQALAQARSAFAEFAYGDAEAMGRAAFERAVTVGAEAVALQAAKLLTLCMNNQHKRREALAWAERGLALKAPPGHEIQQAHLAVLRGDVLACLGRSEEALASLQQGLRGLDDSTPRQPRRDVLTAVGLAYASLRLLPEALEALRSALAALDDSDAPHAHVRCLVNVLDAVNRLADDLQAGDPAAARAVLAGAQAELGRLALLAERSDWIHARLAHAFAAAALERRQGLLAQARARLLAMLHGDQTELLGSHSVQLEIATELAAIARADGDIAGARHWADRALSAAQALGSADAITDMLLLGSQMAEASGDLARALELHKRYHAQVMTRERQQLGERLAELQNLVGVQALRAERDVLRERQQSMERSLAAATDAARTDVLTGIRNRRALEETFAERRPVAWATLVMVDVDHFKQVNDRHSHLVGDQVLRRLAALMSAHLRSDDVLGRYGGEEFMLLLPTTPPSVARALAERLRGHVQDYPWSELSPGLVVTISMGLAPWSAEDGFDTVAARADAALYEAKAGGRNRVVSAPAPGPEGAR